jgi:uncharacterized SAM-binding protein YcdF (DUF218 family)
MNPDVIILLGGSNDEHGVLSGFTRERAEQAMTEFRRFPTAKVLTTGGAGAHFNTTPRPHTAYVRAYLLALGLPETALIESAESTNTIEDARLSRPIVERYGFRRLIIVTSDFHLPRAQWLFRREFPQLELEFRGAPATFPAEERERRVAHEVAALARLQSSG